jgi:hypothetical protein
MGHSEIFGVACCSTFKNLTGISQETDSIFKLSFTNRIKAIEGIQQSQRTGLRPLKVFNRASEPD